MQIDDFTRHFAAQFENTPADTFHPDIRFRDIAEWDSLTALSVISMIDEEYSKQVTGAELKSVHTIRELFNLVSSK